MQGHEKVLAHPFSLPAISCRACPECHAWSCSVVVVPGRLCVLSSAGSILGAGLAQHPGKEQQPDSMSVSNWQMCDQCCIQMVASCARACVKDIKCSMFKELK